MSLSKKRVFSIIESFLFVSPEPRSLSEFETLFKGDLKVQEIKKHLEELVDIYNKEDRGVVLEKVDRSWQMRTKLENKDYLSRVRPSPVFRLSKPSLEVLAIIAFEQPCPKIRIDEIRGVDSGHLLRTLIDKKMICWAGQSDIPGKPSLYKTSKSFLETFGLESLKALPSKQELEELFGDLNEKEDSKTLQSASEEWDEKQNSSPKKLQKEQKDEEESKNIKSLLKSFPAHFDFLKKSEEKTEETQENKKETATKKSKEKVTQKTDEKEEEAQENKKETTTKKPEKATQKTDEKETENKEQKTQENKEETKDKKQEEKATQKTQKDKEAENKGPEEKTTQETENKKVKEKKKKETKDKEEDTEK